MWGIPVTIETSRAQLYHETFPLLIINLQVRSGFVSFNSKQEIVLATFPLLRREKNNNKQTALIQDGEKRTT